MEERAGSRGGREEPFLNEKMSDWGPMKVGSDEGTLESR